MVEFNEEYLRQLSLSELNHFRNFVSYSTIPFTVECHYVMLQPKKYKLSHFINETVSKPLS